MFSNYWYLETEKQNRFVGEQILTFLLNHCKTVKYFPAYFTVTVNNKQAQLVIKTFFRELIKLCEILSSTANQSEHWLSQVPSFWHQRTIANVELIYFYKQIETERMEFPVHLSLSFASQFYANALSSHIGEVFKQFEVFSIVDSINSISAELNFLDQDNDIFSFYKSTKEIQTTIIREKTVYTKPFVSYNKKGKGRKRKALNLCIKK